MMKGFPPAELVIDEGLFLKKLHSGSADLIFRAIDGDREHLRRWMPFVDDTRKSEDTELFIKSILHTECPRKDLVYEIWADREFAGLIALKEVDGWNKKTELGYWIISRFEGRGIATRSSRALVELCFTQLGLNRVQLRVAVGNARSSLVAERLQFRFEGIERAGELHHGRYFDLLVYSILKEEWQG